MSQKIKTTTANSQVTFGNYDNSISSNNIISNNNNYKLKQNKRLSKSDINNTISKINYLDYTFLSHKNTISLSTSLCINNKNTKDYLYDLNQTLELNIQILEQLIKSKYKNKEINKLFETLRRKIDEKNIKKKKVIDFNSKILIDKQIIEEKKRKIEENNEYYKEKINESESNSSNKNEYIKIVEKKLYEVEIYIQNNTKNIQSTKYDKYKNWRLRKFLDENIAIIRKKNNLVKEKVELQLMINEAKKENKNIQIEYKNNIDAISKVKNKNEKKIREVMNKYKKEIFVIGNKMKMLKANINLLNNKFKLFSYINDNDNNNNNNKENNIIESKKSNENINLNINNQNKNNISINKDTSMLPHDMTIKLNNFMDFSLILNKKEESKIDESIKNPNIGNPFSNLSNTNIWDISVINKN